MKVVVTLEGDEAIEYLKQKEPITPKTKAKPKAKTNNAAPKGKSKETKYTESDVKEALMELHSTMGGGVENIKKINALYKEELDIEPEVIREPPANLYNDIIKIAKETTTKWDNNYDFGDE